ncbi:MAG: PAS domain S-box protein [Candidatus Methanoperedens sp.]
MTKTNHALKMLVIIVTVFLIGYFLESFKATSSVLGDYFEVATELLPLVLAFSIFVTTWIAYRKNHDYFSLFLGEAFLIIWLFDTFHMLSLPFMPAFITPNSLYKAAFFWSMARLISAILFLASAYIYKNNRARVINIPLLFIASIAVSFISLPVALFYSGNIPYYPYRSQSDASVFIALISSAITLYACYLYSRRFKETGETEKSGIICLIYGFVIYAVSNLVYLPYDYSGHLLKAAGFYCVYLALFRFSIEMPYEKSDESKKKLIHEAEEKYRSMFDNANDAIITTDLDDRITSWNKAAEKVFGWKMEEVTGKKVSELTIVPPHLKTERDMLIRNVMSGGAVSGVETVRLRKDGAAMDISLTISPWLDADQNIIGFSSILRDITERKRAEKALQQSEEKYRTLIDNIQDGVFIIQDEKIQFANEAFARIGGYMLGEVIGKSFRELVAPEDLELVADRYRRREAGENVPQEYEFRILHKDGTRIIVNMNVGLITYHGRVASMGTMKDITERKRAEEHTKESLKEKEILLREIHHRVKNNMQIISSMLRLQSEYLKDEKYSEMFKESQNRIITMSLVHEKLYQSNDFTKIDLNGYVKDIVHGLYQSYGINTGKIALNIIVEDVLLVVDSAIPCGLIINELVTNSLKHAFPDSRKGELKIVVRRTGENWVELVISDNGIGIPEDIDFRKTETLGLQLVTILVESQLHGEIYLDRSKGTEFKIRFKGAK